MRLRPMTRGDIPACVTIATDAFIDDDLNALLAPRRREYPLAWRRATFERMRKRLTSPAHWSTVCVQDRKGDGNAAEEVIMGYAVWVRHSGASSRYSDSPYLQNNSGLSAKLERMLYACEDEFNWHLRTNQAIDHPLNAMFRGAGGGEPPLWASLGDRWYLISLAVSPASQRRGVGARLVEWGLERCREEAAAKGLSPLPAVLISSSSGRPLYTKMGFKVAAWLGEEFNVEGGVAMVWDEAGEWTAAVVGKVSKGGRPIDILIREDQQEKERMLSRGEGRELIGDAKAGEDVIDVVDIDDPAQAKEIAIEAVA